MLSCVETIPLDSLPVNKILVVNGLITPDSLFSCTVSRVFSINDTSDHFIDCASVKIIDADLNVEVCTLSHVSEGYYKSADIKPVAGKTYQIEISSEGYPTIKGTTTVPFQQKADNVYVVKEGGYDPISGDDYAELHFSIQDQSNDPNYYEVSLASLNKWGVDYEIIPGQIMKKVELEDSIYIICDANYYYSYTIVDAVLQAEGLMRYNPSSLVFSDQLFNNLEHDFIIRCSFTPSKSSFFILYSLSPELYKFRTTLIQHQYEIGAKGISRFDDLAGLDFSSKAIDVYSNIDGGYGIFAGYNTHTLFSAFETPEEIYDEYGNLIETVISKIILIDQTKNPYEY